MYILIPEGLLNPGIEGSLHLHVPADVAENGLVVYLVVPPEDLAIVGIDVGSPVGDRLGGLQVQLIGEVEIITSIGLNRHNHKIAALGRLSLAIEINTVRAVIDRSLETQCRQGQNIDIQIDIGTEAGQLAIGGEPELDLPPKDRDIVDKLLIGDKPFLGEDLLRVNQSQLFQRNQDYLLELIQKSAADLFQVTFCDVSDSGQCQRLSESHVGSTGVLIELHSPAAVLRHEALPARLIPQLSLDLRMIDSWDIEEGSVNGSLDAGVHESPGKTGNG